MSGWAARRFWTNVSLHPVEGGFSIHLDTRQVMTPGRAPLILPSAALARAVADEWCAQEHLVAPETMSLTRAANSAIDKVRPHRSEVEEEIAGFGASDLLCYRAASPSGLVARQAAGWDPLLQWSATALGAPMIATTGIVFVEQPAASLHALAAHVAAYDDFTLTALSDLVGLTGSLVIGLAVLRQHQPPEALWPLSRIDEDWQAELWGLDAEAEATAEARRQAFLRAALFAALARDAAR
ncbi:MAG: ATPase [Rhodobacteraceae bacterium]|nr:ATPase [Paracoccaceae bacterium]